MNRYICIHAHFYQPPRENPWLEEVEQQDSAYPYHDWNSRITAECYARNTVSRILAPDRKIIDIANNYSRISFNFGATLLSWMQKHYPDVLEAIVEADRISRERFSGHGSALAQAYNHMIMPLASERDKKTQVEWGIRDFEHRFSRSPEGMWLPEAAVDLETLDILAQSGITFTILAPRQARQVKKMNGGTWQKIGEQGIDPQMPYLCTLPSGKAINLFFYDGPISQDVAFAGLLENGEYFADRLVAAFPEKTDSPRLVHIATDGETYGHHHKNGDMALSYCLYHIGEKDLAEITVYGEYLSKYPPTHEVLIHENSSWSCIHGVERWKSDCGCSSGMHPEWHQKWRAPLRGALDWLRDNIVQIYADHMQGLAADPWQTRDDYIDIILDRSEDSIDSFITEHAGRALEPEEQPALLKLLEMQRHALLMYTSCGWFFDEISGLESVQILTYAARAMQLAREVSGISLEEAFITLLEKAPSNIAERGNGAAVYAEYVQPARLDLFRVAAHYALTSLFTDYDQIAPLYTYTAQADSYERYEMGKQKAAVGSVRIRSTITREQSLNSFAVLHLGDHNFTGGAAPHVDQEWFSRMQRDVRESFDRGDIADVIRQINTYFQESIFSLWHLFRDEQRDIINRLLGDTRDEVETSFRQIHQHHYPIMQVVDSLNLPLPGYFSVVVDFIVNTDICSLIEEDQFDGERLQRLVDEARKWHLNLNNPRFNLAVSEKIAECMDRLSRNPDDYVLMQSVIDILSRLAGLTLDLDLWKAQNIYFTVGRDMVKKKQQLMKHKNTHAAHWLETFKQLGDCLQVRID